VGWWDVPKQCILIGIFVDPKSPKLIVPEHTMSLEWYIIVILCMIQYICECKTIRMYQCMDILFLGRFILGTRDPGKLVRGHIVSGSPNTPPYKNPPAKSMLYSICYTEFYVSFLSLLVSFELYSPFFSVSRFNLSFFYWLSLYCEPLLYRTFISLVGWRDVPKQCVPIWMFWDPWSPK